MPEREEGLSTLSPRLQIAFAAICAERGLLEGAKFSKHDILGDQRFREALDLAWRYAAGEKLDYDKQARATHEAVVNAIPDLDDPGADEVLSYVASAVARTLVVLSRRERSAAAARSAGDSMIDLVGLVYEDHEKAEAEEEAWQLKAIELLRAWGDKSVTRDVFAANPEYERGAVFKPFRGRGQKGSE